MRYHTVMIWGLAVALSSTLALPALAKKDDGGWEARPGAQVFVTNGTDDDARAFQQWYGEQVRGYDEIDAATGECVGDLLQLVAESTDGLLTLYDRQSVRHTAVVTSRTRITFEPSKRSWEPPGLGRSRSLPRDAERASRIRAGDLVIAQGYLRANGGFVATNIRVVGHSWGWGTDENPSVPTYDGYRAWGDITRVDSRGRIVVDSNVGQRYLTLSRGGVVLVDNRPVSLNHLRRGDRVVFYYLRRTNDMTVEAYRIVLLRSGDADPIIGKPCCTDPYYDPHQDAEHADMAGPVAEGCLEYVSAGLFFNKMVLTAPGGQQYTLRLGKSLQAVGRSGERISILNLRKGERLRVYYFELAGGYFAQRVEVR